MKTTSGRRLLFLFFREIFYIPADLVFKNQAIGDKGKPQGQSVNDLRTEFHK